MDNDKKWSIRMPVRLWLRIVRACARQTLDTDVHITPAEWVREACEQRLEK